MSDTVTPAAHHATGTHADHAANHHDAAAITPLAPPAPELVDVLEVAPAVEAVPTSAAPKMVPLDPAVVPELDHKVDTYVAEVLSLDVHSPEFAARADDVRSLGDEAVRASSEVSARLMASPVRALKKGPLSDSGKVATTLVELRATVEGLDPSGGTRMRKLLHRLPKGDRLNAYFRGYESAQKNLDAIVGALHDGQDELRRDNAALSVEKQQMWDNMQRLVQYVYVAEEMDRQLSVQVVELSRTDPERARKLSEDVLFYVRQKRQDLLTQLAVAVQGYMAIDLVRRNNTELIKGVDRATTTTVAALRTAVVVSQALSNQKLVLDQVDALGSSTAQLMQSTSQMLSDQSVDIARQAADPTVGVEALQAAFDNIYRSMDAIDSFKVEALDAMSRTVASLEAEVVRSQQYLSRVHEPASPAVAPAALGGAASSGELTGAR